MQDYVQVYRTNAFVNYHYLLACPTNCATCTSASVCQTCKASFGLVSDQCITCPAGTYLNAGLCPSISNKCLRKLSLFISLSNKLCYLYKRKYLPDMQSKLRPSQ